MKIEFHVLEDQPFLYLEIAGSELVYAQETPDKYGGAWIDYIVGRYHLSEGEDAILRDQLVIAHEQYRLYSLLSPLIPTLNQYL